MNPIETGLRRVDGVQRRYRPLAVAFAVNKKFGDDTATNMAALITYYGFLSLFPLLLVLVTILGIVAGNDPQFAQQVEHSAIAQFPLIGGDIRGSIHALHKNSAFGLTVGLIGMVWGSQGVVSIGQQAMATVWNVPRTDRPGFLPRTGRSFLMLAVAAVFLLASTGAAGFASFAPSFAHDVPDGVNAAGYAVSALLNVTLYLLAFRILTPKSIPSRSLRMGAVVGGLVWSGLQDGATLLLNHQFHGAQQLYGTFGVVLFLLAWIFLGARITLYAAEFNVVRARRLWPRSLMSPPLTPADREVYTALALSGRYKPQQTVESSFEPDVTDTAGSDPASGNEPPRDPPEEPVAMAPGSDPETRIIMSS